MKNTIFILSLVLCFSCQNKKSDKKLVIRSLDNSLQTELDSLYNIGVFNGFSTTIVDTTGIVYNQGFGYADVDVKKKYTENTIINIASVSKVFIGVALLKAQEMKLLNLNDPINKYLPFKVIHPNYPDEVITIRQLATHTSSIVDTDVYMETCYINKDDVSLPEGLKRYELYYKNPSKDWIPLAEYLGKLLQKDEVFYNTSTFSDIKPGELYEYSNIGAALCAFVIESAANKSFNEFTKEHIFKPLGMSSTSWFFEEVDSTNYSKLYADDQLLPYYKILSYPDGGLITSSTDLSQFLIDLIKGYSGNGTLLSSNSYNELFRPQLQQKAFEKKKNKNEGFNVGLFLELEPAYNSIGHTGGDPGTNTMMFFNTDTGKGRIFIANTDSRKENSMEIFWGIWNVLDKY